MRFGFAGAGAVGCHYASLLAQAGFEAVCLMRGQHLRAIQKHGLTHISNGQERKVDIKASDDPVILKGTDIVVLTCKMTDLQAMLEAIAGHVRGDALIVTLQNGVQAPGMVAEHFSCHGIAAGSAFIGVRIERPGVVVHSAAGGVRAGIYCGASERIRQKLLLFIDALSRAGTDARQVADIQKMLWRKLLWNCGFNAITALTHSYARDIADRPATRDVALAAMREAVAVAQAEGIRIGEDDIKAHMQATLNMGPVKTSMWQDVERGRPAEVDYINGFVAKRAAKLGIGAPVNRMLTAMIHALEEGIR